MIADPAIRAAKAMLAAHRKAIKAGRPKRVQPVAEGQRKPRVHEPAFLAYLRRQPCVIGQRGHVDTCMGPIQACHIRTPKPGEKPTGLQRKPDDCRATPMCVFHHQLQHGTNEMRFWKAYGLDPFAIAEGYHADYLAGFERRRTPA